MGMSMFNITKKRMDLINKVFNSDIIAKTKVNKNIN